MTKDLATSQIERQNVLNNRIAIPRIQNTIGIHFLEFNGKYYLTKQMVANFFEVDIRTIDNYLSTSADLQSVTKTGIESYCSVLIRCLAIIIR